jgi:hypothetical protein
MKVVESRLIQMEKSTYNTLRSFVESSEKEQYVWNVGIARDDFIEFVKPGKWRVIITAEKAQLVSLRAFKTVAEFNGRNLTIYDDGDKVEFDVNDVVELMRTFIISDVPYAIQIRVYDVCRKLEKYYAFVRDYMAIKQEKQEQVKS